MSCTGRTHEILFGSLHTCGAASPRRMSLSDLRHALSGEAQYDTQRVWEILFEAVPISRHAGPRHRTLLSALWTSIYSAFFSTDATPYTLLLVELCHSGEDTSGRSSFLGKGRYARPRRMLAMERHLEQ